MWGLLAIPSIVGMIISDFRSRTVRVRALVVTCVMIDASAISEYGLGASLENMAANGFVFLFIGLCVMLYLRIRKIRVSEAVGGGDILFVLILLPLFALKEFLLFMTISTTATLSVWLVHATFLKSRREKYCRTIPLVSGLGICLTLHLVALSFDLYRFIDL